MTDQYPVFRPVQHESPTTSSTELRSNCAYYRSLVTSRLVTSTGELQMKAHAKHGWRP